MGIQHIARSERRGGDVAIIHKSNLLIKQIQRKKHSAHFELLECSTNSNLFYTCRWRDFSGFNRFAMLASRVTNILSDRWRTIVGIVLGDLATKGIRLSWFIPLTSLWIWSLSELITVCMDRKTFLPAFVPPSIPILAWKYLYDTLFKWNYQF
jgi:hypothetical protein